MTTQTNAEKRRARARVLASELNAKIDQNTDTSRARCVNIAKELVGLLEAEDRHQRGSKPAADSTTHVQPPGEAEHPRESEDDFPSET